MKEGKTVMKYEQYFKFPTLYPHGSINKNIEKILKNTKYEIIFLCNF